MSFARIEHAGGAAITTLSSDISNSDTSLTLVASTNWPTGGTGPFYLVIDPGLSGEEKILATARSSSSLTGLTRGVDGTSASAHTAGATIKHIFTAVEADEANQAAKATLGAIAAKGDILTGSASQTLAKTTVGANDTVLVAASGQTGGVTWQQVAAANIASDAVTTVKILNANVTAAKLATGVADQSTITGGNGTTLAVPTGGITTTQILDATIVAGDIANSTITIGKLAVTPGVKVHKTGAQTIPDNTSTALTFAAEDYDTDTMHSTVTNTSRITFTTAGRYGVGCGGLEWATNTTGIRQIALRVNGTDIIDLRKITAPATIAHGLYMEHAFSAADYVELMVLQNSGGDLNVEQHSYGPYFFASYRSA